MFFPFPMEFHSFPSTPYIWDGQKRRQEKQLSQEETERLLTKELLVQEKIDGTNIGICFDEEEMILFQHRGDYIRTEEKEYQKLRQWCNRHREDLETILGTRKILFGEWMLQKHTIFYDRLPSYFLAFDLFDREENKFVSQESLALSLKETSIYLLPLLYKGTMASLSDLQNLLGKSHFGSESMEGVYLRIDSGEWNEERAKYVLPSFHQSIKKHWKKQERVLNYSMDPIEKHWSNLIRS